MQAEIRFADAFSQDLHELIAELDEELRSRYPGGQIFGVDFSDPKVASMTFVVAYIEGEAAGCGGIRPLEAGVAELKRFFLRPGCRGRGIAAKMLSELERAAVSQGIRLLKLETGEKQPEAIRLYTREGYTEIPLYGEYIGHSDSVCFEKKL